MKLGLAKRIACEEERLSQKQKDQWRSYVLSNLDDQRNIREVVARHPYKEDTDNA
jgi:hypothetical protein